MGNMNSSSMHDDKATLKRRIKLQKQIQSIKNQMDFVEILCNFWPLPNMSQKHRRLKNEMETLQHSLRQMEEPAEVEETPAPVYYRDNVVAFHSNPFMRRALVN
jgi:hypothetical protein